MDLILKKCVGISVDSVDFLEASEKLKVFLLNPACNLDGVNFTSLLSGDRGLVARLSHSGLKECTAVVEVCATLLPLRTSISGDDWSRLAATCLTCMYRHTDRDFWNMCLSLFLCKMSLCHISSPSLVIHAVVNQPTDKLNVQNCLKDPAVIASLAIFLATVSEAANKQNKSADFNTCIELFNFVGDVLKFVQNEHSAFLKLFSVISSTILRAYDTAKASMPPLTKEFNEASESFLSFTFKHSKYDHSSAFIGLQNLTHLNPKLFLVNPILTSMVNFILGFLRLPVSRNNTKMDAKTQSSGDVMSVFLDLLQQIELHGLKECTADHIYIKFFDILRAFPVDDDHATARLYAWWRFICLIPQNMLFSGFRRFVSPFLANLLGRYISMTSFLGDPNLHRYQLSSASVYDGNSRAFELASHVFSSLFDYPELAPKALSNGLILPRISNPTILLTEHNYPLLVALFHWLRYACGSRSSEFSNRAGDIWVACLKRIYKATVGSRLDDELSRKISMHQLVDPSIRLVMPYLQGSDTTSFGSLITPKNDVSRPPSNADCVTILRGIADIVNDVNSRSELKVILSFKICVSCLNLISNWHREVCLTNSPDSADYTALKKLGQLAIQLVEKDARLCPHDVTLIATNEDHLKLLCELLSALTPECLNFVYTSLPADSQDSNLSTCTMASLYTSSVNETGLRVWCFLADRITQLTLLFKRVVELPKMGLEKQMVISINDLSTMFAFCLAPVFMAGNSTDSLSTEQEREVWRSLFSLFRVFHTEACLLTSIPVNSWIDELGGMLAELIHYASPNAPKKLNMNFIACFLVHIVKSAEGVDENVPARFSPSKWLARTDRPLGQMNGPVDAISRCLTLLPLQQSETCICSPSSPSALVSSSRQLRGRRRRALNVRTLKVDPLSPTNIGETALFAPGQQPLCSLLNSLCLILQRYVRTTEAVLQLIDMSSSGLLALGDRLASVCTINSHEETHRSLVTAFEALVILTWDRLQQCFFNRGVASPSQPEETATLIVPEHSLHRLIVFCEAVLRFAAIPVATSNDQLTAVARVSPSTKKANNTEGIEVRQRKQFINCMLSLFNTLVASTPIKQSALSDKISVLKGRLSHCLTNETMGLPQSFSKWALLRDWIPGNLLHRQENKPPSPAPSLKHSANRRGRTRKSITHVTVFSDDDEEGNLSLAEFQQRLKQEVSSHALQQDADARNGSSSQLSSTQTPPKQNQPICGSLLNSRRLGTLTEPRNAIARSAVLSPHAKPVPVTTRRRLSLAPSRHSAACTTPVKRSVPSSNWQSSLLAKNASDRTVSTVENIRQRLFSDSRDDNGCLCEHPTTSAPSRGRKRAHPGGSGGCLESRPPPPSEFEDSAQFVFIPPTDFGKKRMRLSEHQKERRHEQREAYIPSMYNDLDASQQSLNSLMYNYDSQSSLESSVSLLRQPVECQLPDQSAVVILSPLVVEIPQSASEISESLQPLPHNDVTSPFEATQETKSPPSFVSGKIEADAPQNQALHVNNLSTEDPLNVEISTDSKQMSVPEESSIIPDTEPWLCKAPLASQPIEDTHITLPSTRFSQLRNNYPPSQSPFLLSDSPVVSRTTPTVLKSPLLGGSTGKRAQKILEMGLAKAAERSRQRQPVSALKNPSEAASTASSPVAPRDDQPGWRPGILRNLTTPRPRSRVSFAPKPIVFFLTPPSRPLSTNVSHKTSPIKSLSRSEVEAPLLPPSKADEFIEIQSQDSQQIEVSYSPVEVTQSSPIEVTSIFSKEEPDLSPNVVTSESSPVRAENLSPPSISPSLGPRRRKSAPPKRCAPIDRSSREALRNSLGKCALGSPFRPVNCRRLFFSTEDDSGCSPVKKTTGAAASKVTVDLDSSSPLQESTVSASPLLHHFNNAITVNDSQQQQTQVESASKSPCITDTQEEGSSSGHLIEETQEINTQTNEEPISGHEDLVESSQETNISDVVFVEDTESKPHDCQSKLTTLDKQQCVEEKLETTLLGEKMTNPSPNTTPKQNDFDQKVAQPETVDLARQTLNTLRSQITALSLEQQKDLLFEALALFKNIMQ